MKRTMIWAIPGVLLLVAAGCTDEQPTVPAGAPDTPSDPGPIPSATTNVTLRPNADVLCEWYIHEFEGVNELGCANYPHYEAINESGSLDEWGLDACESEVREEFGFTDVATSVTKVTGLRLVFDVGIAYDVGFEITWYTNGVEGGSYTYFCEYPECPENPVPFDEAFTGLNLTRSQVNSLQVRIESFGDDMPPDCICLQKLAVIATVDCDMPGPTGLTLSAPYQWVNMNWNASSAPCGSVASYEIHRTGVPPTTWTQVGTSTTNSWTDNTTAPITQYTYKVRAVDNLGNKSSFSATKKVTTGEIYIEG